MPGRAKAALVIWFLPLTVRTGPPERGGGREKLGRALGEPRSGDKARGNPMGASEIGSDLPYTPSHSLCDVAPSRADRHVAERRTSDGGGAGPLSSNSIGHLDLGQRRKTTTSWVGHSRFAVYLASPSRNPGQGLRHSFGLLSPRLSYGTASLWSPAQPTLSLLREPLHLVVCCAMCTRHGLRTGARHLHVPRYRLHQHPYMYGCGWELSQRVDLCGQPPTLPEIQAALQAAY